MKVKGTPVSSGSVKPGGYNFGDTSSMALCEQLRGMQKDMASTKRAITDLLEMNRQMLESMQDQHRTVEVLINRVDKASSNGDEAVQKMADSAKAMELNTEMIIKPTLALASIMSKDEEEYKQAITKAEQEIKSWKEESDNLKQTATQAGLKIV